METSTPCVKYQLMRYTGHTSIFGTCHQRFSAGFTYSDISIQFKTTYPDCEYGSVDGVYTPGSYSSPNERQVFDYIFALT